MKHFTLLAALAAPLAFAETKPLDVRAVRVSSETYAGTAKRIIDGDARGTLVWSSRASAEPQWLELDLGEERELAGLHVYSGANRQSALRDFVVQFEPTGKAGTWTDIPSASVRGNENPALELRFDDTVVVRTRRLRLWITKPGGDLARVAEVVVWPASRDGVPAIPRTADQLSPVSVFLNQAGFNAGAPKRFTAPEAADGTVFEVRPLLAGGSRGDVVFSGKIRGNIGDLSAFEPADSREYVVVVGTKTSVPFSVAPWLLERTTYQGTVDFMIDSRHYVGNERAVCVGSYGWRDDHHFGWELHSLVPQWLSNPSAYARMPRQIVYEKPADPKLWGKLEAPAAEAPDVVKLIHWGADVIVTQGLTHELLKSQLAYFLYAWPTLSAYLPRQNYEVVRDFAFDTWTRKTADRKYPYDESPEHDLLALKTRLGSTKGTYPPGFSVEPNLLMHEVAVREGRPDAKIYLDAAVRQAAWMVEHLDWNDPQTTKGQRCSEWLTLTGLGHLLASYPESAPAGLRAKINAWAAVVVRRSDNLWDFRKLGDAPDQWTPTGEKPTMWNEPGNVVGLPASILAALPFIDDAGTAARLREIAWAHFDSLFGRNPTGRHFSYAAARELTGVEHGWYHRHIGGIGRLEKARFVIDGSPKNRHFPYRPEAGDIGWTEGWVQHNTPFHASLAYLARATTKLQLSLEGATLVASLTGPLNFDPKIAESATLTVETSTGARLELIATETTPDSGSFVARVALAATDKDAGLPAPSGATITAAYGYGYLGQRATLTLPR